MSASKKSLFTPCRQVGLKRKSVGFTPPTFTNAFQSQHITPSSTTVIDGRTESQRISESLEDSFTPLISANALQSQQITPSSTAVIRDRTEVQRDSESPEQNSTSPTSLKQLQPVTKRIKSSVVRRIAAIPRTELPQEQETTKLSFENNHLESLVDNETEILTTVETLPQESCNYDQLSLDDIQLRIDRITKQISEKQAQIVDLKYQSSNAAQHDLPMLNDLIQKWRLGCQQALHELLTENINRNKNCSISDLLRSFGIPAALVHYSDTEMDFYD